MVVRESMSRDLLDRLVADIFEVTEALAKLDQHELGTWQPGPSPSVEKVHASSGHQHKDRHLAERPMSEGVHRSVC